jgi:hypothetical protein
MTSSPFLHVLSKHNLCLQEFSQDSFMTWAAEKITDD